MKILKYLNFLKYKLQLIKIIDIEKEKINNYINESKKHIRNYKFNIKTLFKIFQKIWYLKRIK